jgi:hypothetical protein
MLDIIQEQIIAADLPQDLSRLAEHCVNSTFFVHKRKYYQQVQGIAMQSPLSPCWPTYL